MVCMSALSSTEIKVRGYSFSPFLDFKQNGEAFGATIEIIKELNMIQDKYHFKFYKTSSKRRYNHFENDDLDVIFFEDKAWGWNKYKINSTDVFAKGGEVYITKYSPKKTQNYFKNFSNKKLIGVLGFHYGFANFDANENTLKRKYNMLLTSSPESIINLILKGRGHIGVITESLLRKQLKEDKSLKRKIMISENYDQKYKHTALVNANSPITKDEMNKLINELRKTNKLIPIFKQYGIKF